MNPEENPVHWKEYMDLKFQNVYDKLDGLRGDMGGFEERVVAVEARVEAVNGRIWTVGAVTGAVGTGLGAIVAWLTIWLEMGKNFIRVGR